MLHTIIQEQFLPLCLETAWDFFSDPGNLCRITPKWLNFTLSCPSPERMYAGQILTYTIQPFPWVSTSWVTEITHVNEPYFFVDEQRLGPYAFWHHQHLFHTCNRGIMMQDIVNYTLPMWYFGDLIHVLFVKHRLQKIFCFRQQALDQMFPAPSSS
jgi:ligand-binding SRPBCC domain-containing protein